MPHGEGVSSPSPTQALLPGYIDTKLGHSAVFSPAHPPPLLCLLFTAPLCLFVSHSVSMYLFHTVSESHDSSLLLSLASDSVSQLFMQSPDLLALETGKSSLSGAQNSS